MSKTRSKDFKVDKAYQKIKDMPRSDIRYRLYRLRNENQLDPKDGISDYYKEQPGFRGFKLFAIEWDIGKDDNKFKIKRRLLTELEEWEAVVRQHVS